jgi:tRNA modification GTPase
LAATVPDTIVAVASPVGRGAVSVLRVSGPAVPDLARQVLGSLPAPRSARLATFCDSDGLPLDRGLALYFPAPASFTGEHVLELQGHGGAVVIDLLVGRLLALGCRLARPGEFSERAFLNGKLDVTQAEAIADLIDAGTVAAARSAVRSMQGAFSLRVEQLQAQLTELRVYVEAAIDFPDEEIDFLTDRVLDEKLRSVFEAFESIRAAAQQGALLRDGMTVVLAGAPNAGKSSLLNRLTGDEVAIVTALPGTTRDVLRQHLQLDGLPLHLVDTAGLRTAVDAVEEEGIRRARAEMRRADHVLYIVEASGAAADLPSELAGLPPASLTVVVNKIDLSGESARIEQRGDGTRLFVSALTGAGVDLLRTHLKALAGYRPTQDGTFSARRRHLDALRRADELTRTAAAVLKDTRAFELFAEDLRLAQQALGEITGEFTSDDLLGEIFGSFCIGK